VEAIAEYLQMHAGLHFSLGLAEMPIYEMPNGDRLVAPRVLARTTLVTRSVVAVPDGYTLQETDFEADDPERSALGALQQAFWVEFLRDLKLDDPEQPKANPAKSSLISFSMPAPNQLALGHSQFAHWGSQRFSIISPRHPRRIRDAGDCR
jgi:hypothetical protein